MFGLSKLAAMLGIVAITLTGCIAEDPSLLSAEERSIRAIEQQRKNTAIAVGALAGGGLALIATRDQSREEQLRGVALGVLAGGLAGFATGEYVNTRTRQFSNEQQTLRSLIAAADRDIANYRGLNETSRRLINQQRNKVRQLNRGLANNTQTTESYRTQIASASNNIRSLDTGIRDISKQISVMREDRDGLRANNKPTAGLSSRIASLEAEKRTLESRRRALASVYDEVPDSVGSYDF